MERTLLSSARFFDGCIKALAGCPADLRAVLAIAMSRHDANSVSVIDRSFTTGNVGLDIVLIRLATDLMQARARVS